jgi:hypothetical protein
MSTRSEFEKSLNEHKEKFKKEYPEYHVFIYYHDGCKVEFKTGSRWIRQQRLEIKDPNPIGPKTWHYECYIILEGALTYEHPAMRKSKRGDYIASTRETDSQDDTAVTYQFPLKQEFTPKTWMARLDNGLQLFDLALPATHCSYAGESLISGLKMNITVSPEIEEQMREMHSCQAEAVKDQLNKGVRVLDMRCGPYPWMSKGPFTFHSELGGILQNECEKFVKDNPSETVIVLLRWAQEAAKLDLSKQWPECYSAEPIAQPESFSENIEELLAGNKNWYITKSDKPMLRLEDTRGKCVLVPLYNNDSRPFTEALDDRQTGLENINQLVSQRWDKIEAKLQSDSSDAIRIVSLSATLERNPEVPALWVHPRASSKALKKKLVNRMAGMKMEARLWIFCDYITDDVIQPIIRLNMRC